MELRERVKAALLAKMPDVHGLVGDGYYRLASEQLAEVAIAAVLDAMQEPTQGMVEIGTKSTFTPVDGQDAELVWSNMLAAFRTEALGEG